MYIESSVKFLGNFPTDGNVRILWYNSIIIQSGVVIAIIAI